MPEYIMAVYHKYWPLKAVDELVASITQKMTDAGIDTKVTVTPLEKPTRLELTFEDVPSDVKWTHKEAVDEVNKRFPALVKSY